MKQRITRNKFPKEAPIGDTWNSPGRINRKDLLRGLGVGGDANMGDCVGAR